MNFRLCLPLAAALLLAACSGQKQPPAAENPDPLRTIVEENTLPESQPFFNQMTAGVGQTGFAADANVQQFVRYQERANGMDAAELNRFFNSAVYRPNIIAIMNRPGTSRPWYAFAKDNTGSLKTNGGRRFYQNNRDALDRIAAEYGVPAGVIAAVIGIETNYGANKGSIRLADSLSTLAFDYPRRGEFFQKELAEFLLLAKEEHRDPFEFTGSYAGAMGMPQFMPSSYRKWAVDYDRDGRRDIWNSVPDAAASVANYLKAHGWQTGGRMMVPVSLTPTPELSGLMERKTAMDHTVADLKRMGVQPQEAVADHEKAVLFRLETAPGEYRYYIGLNNFYAVWQYHNSRMYVSAVRDIANSISGSGL